MHYFKKFEEKSLWEIGWSICVIPIPAQILTDSIPIYI